MLVAVYDYQQERAKLFTEENQRLFIGVRDQVQGLLRVAGAFIMSKVKLPSGIGAAEGWTLMACVDRLVELGELREIAGSGPDRVFVSREEKG